MEFNEKLQQLRKQKGLTQEELADILFVSRTAISKWESGRGYPNLDSLKAIAKFFSITIDELLSGDELLTIAEEDTMKTEAFLRDLVFGLIDIFTAILFFLPFFAERSGGLINEVSLLKLNGVAIYLKAAYVIMISMMIIFGIATLALQNTNFRFWIKNKYLISVVLNITGAMVFILSLQPYAATFLFFLLVIKVFILIKRH